MANYKRQMWTSGYEYRVRCPRCGTYMSYTDRQLGYRSWFPNGFIYCAGCRQPIRHNEIFAVHPDGTPVYKTPAEADAAVVTGYNRALGVPQANAAAPAAYAAPAQSAPAPAEGFAFCPHCGNRHEKGKDKFCRLCGAKLEEQ